MPSLRIVFFKSFRNRILRKLRRAANIKIFHGIKNFLFTCFFCFGYSSGIQWKIHFFSTRHLRVMNKISSNLFVTIRDKAGCFTTTSARQKTTVVDPGVLRQLTLTKYFKLTLYEEGEIELRCERTFLHICRVWVKSLKIINYLVSFF